MVLSQIGRLFAVALVSASLPGVVPEGATAQELYGSVVGTVQDDSGARIPGATIEIVNRDTNLVLTTVSNATGAYTFTNVLAGHVRREGDAAGIQGVRATAGTGDDAARSAASTPSWKSASSPNRSPCSRRSRC